MARRKPLLIIAALLLVPLVLVTAFVAFGRSSSEPAAAGNPLLNPHPVAGSFRPNETKIASCTEGRCWEQAFGNISYYEGPKTALRLFADAIASDPAIESDCHRIAHNIGSAALARYKNDVGHAFAEGAATCWSGYYHGILERALVDVHSKNQLVSVARSLCSGKTVHSTTFLYYQCVHGIGHGLMIHTGLDLMASLRVCEQLLTSWDQTSCDGGVFMENFGTSYGVRSSYLRDNDPVYPCNAIAERHKLYCYLQVTDRMLELSGYDWDVTARECGTVELNWRGTCFQSYGRSASGFSRRNLPLLLSICQIAAKEWRSDCVFGAVRDIVSQDAGGDRAARYCRAVAPSLRERCVGGAGTILFTLAHTKAEFRAACARLTSRYTDICIRYGG